MYFQIKSFILENENQITIQVWGDIINDNMSDISKQKREGKMSSVPMLKARIPQLCTEGDERLCSAFCAHGKNIKVTWARKCRWKKIVQDMCWVRHFGKVSNGWCLASGVEAWEGITRAVKTAYDQLASTSHFHQLLDVFLVASDKNGAIILEDYRYCGWSCYRSR